MLFRYVRRGLDADEETVQRLSLEFGVSPVTAGILAGRGILTEEDAKRFFSSSLEDLRDPFGLDGLEEAAARIRRALELREPIAVYGDYDVDGVCATTMLVEYLRGCDGDVCYYVPSRHTEGYGLNEGAVRSLAGVKLLITVDCGISNAAEVALAVELGMDVIVTDHHECPDALPRCTAVIDPKKPGQDYGFNGLCGTGVALKLVQAMGGAEAALRAVDLAAMATVADIVPLADENLVIVRLGLKAINDGVRPGIKALAEVTGLAGRQIKSGNIGFGLAPRINAGGRMDLSKKSVEMLLSRDEEAARVTARELDADNRERMAVEDKILREAVELIEGGYSFSRSRAIVLYCPHWNTGVTGIVASRIVERYSRPTILFGDGEGSCYGSGRSVPGVHLFQALKACERFFTRYGGHEQAAGCALAPENIGPFRAALDAYLLKTYPEEVFLPLRHYDAELPLERLDMGLTRDMERLEPAGFGNPRPVFLLKGVALAGLTRTADGKHLRMRFGGRGGVEGIAFRQGDAYEMLCTNVSCDALVVPDINTWMGRERVQAIVEHIRPMQGAAHAICMLEQAHACYSKALQSEPGPQSDETTMRRVGQGTGMAMLLDAIQRSCWGTMVLCYSAVAAAQLVVALQAQGLLDRIYLGVGAVPQAGRRENALVLAPDTARLPAGYDALFVLDGPLGAAQGLSTACALNNRENCIIIEVNEDFGSLKRFFSREGLLEVYRRMKSALIRGQGPTARGDWNWLEGVGPWRAEAAARVFIELGLLIERERAPWLVIAAGKKTDLNNSLLYRNIMQYLLEV